MRKRAGFLVAAVLLLLAPTAKAQEPPGAFLGELSWPEAELHQALKTEPRGGHAGEIETSIHLHLQPDRVHMDRARPELGSAGAPLAGYQPGLLSRDADDPDYSATGVFGDPTRATPDKGRRALELMAAEWLRTLELFADQPLPPAPTRPTR